jgi:heat shock protein HslJ
MNMMKVFFVVFTCASIFLLTACSSSGSGRDLTGGIWLLSELNGEPPLPETTLTAEFNEDGQVGGSAGCNSYNTTYVVEGDQLTFGEQIVSTMMACLEPIMEQEKEFQQVLISTASYDIQDDELILFDASGNESARFMMIDQTLASSSWHVIGYNNGKGGVVSVILGSEITANFGEDGLLSGTAGCNHYTARYETEGDSIQSETAEVTEMACLEPEGVMEQERLYLAALAKADTYRIEGLTMEMRSSDGSLMVNFHRVIDQ